MNIFVSWNGRYIRASATTGAMAFDINVTPNADGLELLRRAFIGLEDYRNTIVIGNTQCNVRQFTHMIFCALHPHRHNGGDNSLLTILGPKPTSHDDDATRFISRYCVCGRKR